MRVIARRSLRQFWLQSGREDAKTPLEMWHDEVTKANWHIAGNKYRLVVEIQYRAGIVWVKFLGTHAEYDKIEVETVNEY